MKTKIIYTVLLLTAITFAQNTYELTPGTKGNEIKLTVANTSETYSASNVTVALTKKSTSLNFSKETETIELIEAKAEAEASFKFDINRNAPVNRKDTIDFMITDQNGTALIEIEIKKPSLLGDDHHTVMGPLNEGPYNLDSLIILVSTENF